MNRSTIILLLASLVAGGAVGYAIGSARSEAADPPERSAPDEQEGEHSRPDPGPDEGGAGTRAGYRSLAEAIAAIPRGTYDEGTGEITGHVRRRDGTPLAGVVVRAARMATFGFGDLSAGLPRDKDLKTLVREFVDRERLVRNTRRDAVTDAEGRYVISGLADVDHKVSAHLAGYDIRNGYQVTIHRVRPGRTLNFTATAVVRVPIQVLMPDGSKAPKARLLVFETGRGGGWFTWLPGSPPIAKPPGKYEFLATAGKDDELTSPRDKLELKLGQAPEKLVLRTDHRPGIRGKVVAAGNSGNCTVKLAPLLPGTDPDPQRLVAEGEAKTVWSDKRYDFRNVKPGTYLIGVIVDRNRVMDHAVVELRDGMVEQNLRASEEESDQFVLVRVETPDGEPVERASVTAHYIASPVQRRVGRGRILENGSYRVPFREVEERLVRLGGKYFVQVFTRRYGARRAEFDPKAPGTVTLRYVEPSRLQVTLPGYVDSPYRATTNLELWEVDEERGIDRAARHYGFDNPLTPEGVQTFCGLQPGVFKVSVWVKTDGGGNFLATAARVGVAPGENRHTIPLPPLYTVTVGIGEEFRDHKFRLSRRAVSAGYWGMTTKPPKAGRFTFRRLPAGEYELTAITGAESTSMLFTVPGRAALSFKPAVLDALRVTLGDGTGPLSAAGLRPGDLVVGIDGDEFKDGAHMNALLLVGRRRESVELTVLRGRSRLTLTADLRYYWRHDEKLVPSPR